MTGLRTALRDYLAMRRSLGFKLRRADTLLARFLDFLEAEASPVITRRLAMAWATEGKSVGIFQRRLGLVRGFARYVHSLDPRTEVPSRHPLPKQEKFPPYIYRDEEVRLLMDAARELKHPFRTLTFSTWVGLLSVTGMRMGEMIALNRTDMDWDEGILTIRKGKFGKSRELPLHPTTVEALRAYAEERARVFPRSSSSAFFVSLRGTRLHAQNVHLTFYRLIDRTGLANRKPHRPRIHDLRHTFAVRTLVDWYREGLDGERMLPRLSTYLGHVAPASTYWYLSADPELMGAAAKRLEERLGELP